MARGNKTGGREMGTPNKVTSDIRDSFRLLIESNLENLELWLNAVALKDPAKAMDILIKLSEYVVPKQNRTSSKNESLPTIIIQEIRHNDGGK